MQRLCHPQAGTYLGLHHLFVHLSLEVSLLISQSKNLALSISKFVIYVPADGRLSAVSINFSLDLSELARRSPEQFDNVGRGLPISSRSSFDL